MRVAALDPGKRTGIAEARGSDGEYLFRAWDDPAADAMRWLHSQLSSSQLDLVVCESIVITAATAKKSQDVLISIEQIGVARYLCWCYGVEFDTQTPTERKFGTDSKLHALGWWTKGPTDHPREATRHLITKLVDVDAAFESRVASIV